MAARRLVADGGDEGGVVVEALVALFGGLLGCSLRRESAHLLEVGDGFFGGSARQRYGCGEDGGPDEGDRGSFSTANAACEGAMHAMPRETAAPNASARREGCDTIEASFLRPRRVRWRGMVAGAKRNGNKTATSQFATV